MDVFTRALWFGLVKAARERGEQMALATTGTARHHHSAHAAFRAILPEEIEWKAFATFPATGAPCGRRRSTNSAWTLHGHCKSAWRGEVDAAQAPRGSGLQSHLRYLLHWLGRSLRHRQVGGVPAWDGDRPARQHVAFPLVPQPGAKGGAYR